MEQIYRVEIILEAIASVKKRLAEASKSGDLPEYRKLGEDLLHLEVILVPEAQALVDQIKKIA